MLTAYRSIRRFKMDDIYIVIDDEPETYGEINAEEELCFEEE